MTLPPVNSRALRLVVGVLAASAAVLVAGGVWLLSRGEHTLPGVVLCAVAAIDGLLAWSFWQRSR